MKRKTTRWQHACILVIEDDPGDQEITRRALQRDGFLADLQIVSDGTQAMDYLLWRGSYANAPVPDLILLDLNLPGMNGKQLLQSMKEDRTLRSTPVVVVSTSAREQDIRDCYELGCNSYAIKPLEAHRFIEQLRAIFTYWIGLVALPPRGTPPGERA